MWKHVKTRLRRVNWPKLKRAMPKALVSSYLHAVLQPLPTHTHIYIYTYTYTYIYINNPPTSISLSLSFSLSPPPSIAFSKTFMSGIHRCLSLYKTGIAAWSLQLFHRFSGFISPGHPEPSDWHSWRRRGSEASAEGRSRVDPKQCKTNKAILPINRDWIWFNMV